MDLSEILRRIHLIIGMGSHDTNHSHNFLSQTKIFSQNGSVIRRMNDYVTHK
jgi:hypothetical protein